MIFDAILGAVTGLIGTGLTTIMNFKTQKLKNEHDIAMIQAETNAMIEETKANIKITETEVAAELQIAKQESFDTSQKIGNKVNISNKLLEKMLEDKFMKWPGMLMVFLLSFVDVLRSGMRPAITIMLMVITGYLTYNSFDAIVADEDMFTKEQIFELMGNIIYLTVTVISWWFGNRAVEKYNKSTGIEK